MTEEKRIRARAEQKYVVVLSDYRVIGTRSGGPLTRDAAWLLERWYTENNPEANARAVRIGLDSRGDE